MVEHGQARACVVEAECDAFAPRHFSEDMVASFGRDVPMRRPSQPNELALSSVPRLRGLLLLTGQMLHPVGGEIVGG